MILNYNNHSHSSLKLNKSKDLNRLFRKNDKCQLYKMKESTYQFEPSMNTNFSNTSTKRAEKYNLVVIWSIFYRYEKLYQLKSIYLITYEKVREANVLKFFHYEF